VDDEGLDYYNILSIDGGGIRGIIPGACLVEMEKYAYKYAKEKYADKFEDYKDDQGNIIEAIPMSRLFDMLAGTSTGSLLATGLSIRKSVKDGIDQPLYWAPDALDIYTNGADEIFKGNGLKFWLYLLITLGIILVFIYPYYFCAMKRYNNPGKFKNFQRMREYIEE